MSLETRELLIIKKFSWWRYIEINHGYFKIFADNYIYGIIIWCHFLNMLLSFVIINFLLYICFIFFKIFYCLFKLRVIYFIIKINIFLLERYTIFLKSIFYFKKYCLIFYKILKCKMAWNKLLRWRERYRNKFWIFQKSLQIFRYYNLIFFKYILSLNILLSYYRLFAFVCLRNILSFV